MAFVVKDRVRETSTSSGTGAFVLAGAVPGYQGFSAIGNGNSTYYSIVSSYGDWEVGIGTYTASTTTLSRDTVLSSTNAGALVSFLAGSAKDVFCTYPAERAVYQTAPVTKTADFTVQDGETWIINNKPLPGVFTTFNTATDINMVLTNGNLTGRGISYVSGPDIYRGAVSTTSFTTGKKYFECTQDIAAVSGFFGGTWDYWRVGLAVGIADVTNLSGNVYLGSTATGWAFSPLYAPLPTGMRIYNNNGTLDVGTPTTANGTVISVAVDFDAGKIWFAVNGTWLTVGGVGNPAAGTNPSFTFTPNTQLFAALAVLKDYSRITANFGATPFAYAIPSGFSSWGFGPVSTVATLPVAANYSGQTLVFQNYQNQGLVSASSNVVPLGGGAAGTAILDAVAGNTATLVSNGTNWVIIQATTNNNLLLE